MIKKICKILLKPINYYLDRTSVFIFAYFLVLPMFAFVFWYFKLSQWWLLAVIAYVEITANFKITKK